MLHVLRASHIQHMTPINDSCSIVSIFIARHQQWKYFKCITHPHTPFPINCRSKHIDHCHSGYYIATRYTPVQRWRRWHTAVTPRIYQWYMPQFLVFEDLLLRCAHAVRISRWYLGIIQHNLGIIQHTINHYCTFNATVSSNAWRVLMAYCWNAPSNRRHTRPVDSSTHFVSFLSHMSYEDSRMQNNATEMGTMGHFGSFNPHELWPSASSI